MIKKLTPYHVRKQLAEALVLSRINYGNVIFHNAPPDYRKNRLQKVINATAGYVRDRYSTTIDSLGLVTPCCGNNRQTCMKISECIRMAKIPSYGKGCPYTNKERSNAKHDPVHITNLHTTIEYAAASVFNNLPPDRRASEKCEMFCNLSN